MDAKKNKEQTAVVFIKRVSFQNKISKKKSHFVGKAPHQN